jgi:hypothetical protein
MYANTLNASSPPFAVHLKLILSPTSAITAVLEAIAGPYNV